MTESGFSRRLSGVFHKKSEKGNCENPAAEKKKKHRRHPSVQFPKDWKLQCKGVDQNLLTEADGKGQTSGAGTAKEKEKPKNIRRRLPFGKPKSSQKQGVNSAKDGRGVFHKETAPVESKELSKSTDDRSETKIEIAECKDEDEKNIQKVSSEDESTEALPVMIAEVVLQDLMPDVSSEFQESAGIASPDTCPDEDTAIIPNPEGQNDHEDKIGPSKELVRNEKRAHVDAISSLNCQCDFSLGNLIVFWSFAVSRASDCTKQLLVYFVSFLIKRYPQCFKVQLKKGKRRSRNGQKEFKVSATVQGN